MPPQVTSPASSPTRQIGGIHDDELPRHPPDICDAELGSPDARPLPEFTEVPTGSPRTARTVSTPVRIESRLGDDGEIYNTGSVRIWAVVATTDPSSGLCWRWWSAVLPALVFLLETSTLDYMMASASEPKCASHSECRQGEYCAISRSGNTGRVAPVCVDCYKPTSKGGLPALVHVSTSNGLQVWRKSAKEALENFIVRECNDTRVAELEPWKEELDIDDWWLTREYYEAGNDVSRVFHSNDCLAAYRCEKMDIIPETCDYLKINVDRISAMHVTLFGIISVLLANAFAADIEETAVEEAILDFQTRKSLLPWFSIDRAPSFMMRVVLHCSRISLPLRAALTTALLLLTSQLSVINIVLNGLAVMFVVEVDDMVAALLLTPFQKRRADPVVAKVCQEGVVIPWIHVRCAAFSSALVLPVTMMIFMKLLTMFGNETQGIGLKLCSDASDVYFYLLSWLTVFAACVHLFVRMFRVRSSPKVHLKLVRELFLAVFTVLAHFALFELSHQLYYRL